MRKYSIAGVTEHRQLSLTIYLGEPVLSVKRKLRNPEARKHLDGIKEHSQALGLLVDSGIIQSSEARVVIKNLLKILGES